MGVSILPTALPVDADRELSLEPVIWFASITTGAFKRKQLLGFVLFYFIFTLWQKVKGMFP